MNQLDRDWDVVVVGGGPAGAIAALVMARDGRRVLLVDPTTGDMQYKVGETLPGAAAPLLRNLDLLKLLCSGRHLPCHGTLSAWGSAEMAAVDFVRDPYGHGWRLDRCAFDADLRSAALSAGAQPLRDRISSVERVGDLWLLRRRSGLTLASRWVLDATGRRATVSRQLGAARIHDTGMIALCCRFPAHDADTRTLIEADPYGWWYTALTPGVSRIVVYHVETRAAAPLLHAPKAFEERLSNTVHIQHVLSEADSIGPISALDAGGAYLDRYAGAGWLAVGDAALSFDPLSSQGIFTALYSGMISGRAVLKALSGESPIIGAEYAARMESIRAAYVRHWFEAYANESRWPEHKFWADRQRIPIERNDAPT